MKDNITESNKQRKPGFGRKRICVAVSVTVVFVLVIAGISVLMNSEKPPLEEPDTVRFSAEFQSALDEFQRTYGFPGATAAYVLKDGTTFIAASGLADVEEEQPMTVQSRMLAASIGKTFVGAAAVALARENVLDLDAPLSRWLGDRPWYERLPNNDAITLRHLLTHQSGLADHVHLDSFRAAVSRKWREKSNPFSSAELIEFVLDRPPLFEAGTAWSYSDTGYILMGLVIEESTGRSYYEEIKDRFLIPLNLHLTAPSDQRYLPGLAAGYMAEDNSFGFPRKTVDGNGMMQWHPGFEWTGGGLVSNSRDLAEWGAALFAGNAMPGDYLTDLLQAVPIHPEEPSVLYGLGIGIYQSSPFGPSYGHGGWVPGYSSSLRHYADHRVTVAFQINTDIGIVDDTTALVSEMEERLAQIAIAASNAMHSNGNSAALHSRR